MIPSSPSYDRADRAQNHVGLGSPWARPAELCHATFFVADLACRACAEHAESALARIDGVRSAEVRFLGEMARVTYDITRTSDREIARAMQRAGYRLSRIDGAAPSVRHGLGRIRLGVTLLALFELILLAPTKPDDPTAVGLGVARLVLAGVALTLGGSAIVSRAWALARKGVIGRDATVALAAIASFALGGILLVGQLGEASDNAGGEAFEASAAIIAAALLGRAMYAALNRWALADLASRERGRWGSARRAGESGQEEIVDRHALAIGDRIHLFEGEIVPADLRLETPALLSRPLGDAESPSSSRQAGEIALAGAVLLSGSAYGRVTRPHRSELASAVDAEVLSAIGRADRELGGWSTGEGWRDLAAQSLYACTFTFAVFALVVHVSLAESTVLGACLAATAVGVVASPSAFLLAAPLATTIALARARALGIVVRDPASLDALARIDAACVDKTATVARAAPDGATVAWTPSSDSFRLGGGLAPELCDASLAVRGLWQRGVSARLVSGDPDEATQAVASHLGIPATGGLSPNAKALLVRDLQHGGAHVLYVHDAGDALAANHADIAIAVAPATMPRAVDAPIVLVEAELQTLPWLLDLARAARRRQIECCAIAVVYNAVFVPLAAIGLLTPLEAAALSLLEGFIVLANAARLMRRPALWNRG